MSESIEIPSGRAFSGKRADRPIDRRRRVGLETAGCFLEDPIKLCVESGLGYDIFPEKRELSNKINKKFKQSFDFVLIWCIITEYKEVKIGLADFTSENLLKGSPSPPLSKKLKTSVKEKIRSICPDTFGSYQAVCCKQLKSAANSLMVAYFFTANVYFCQYVGVRAEL